MDDRFALTIQPRCTRATDHAARLDFVDRRGGEVLAIRGTVAGPYCKFARTLPTEFAIVESERSVTVVDPCYWSPSLPFLYRLRGDVEFRAGPSVNVDITIGLRRFEASGPNLRLERRRIVLRGAAADFEELNPLSLARTCEVTLVMTWSGDLWCENADRIGVPMVVDLRGEGEETASILLRLAWRPSVYMALVDARSAAPPRFEEPIPLIATVIGANDDESSLEGRRADVVAVELGTAERPPAWLVNCRRPVIAIRRGVTYASLSDARAECDWLQTQLAPEFDLAGYFVSRQ